ncbi:MAG: S-layer protein [Firmicutes bacterium]|nr:S-layer protein [Bacillota bacterium]
MKKSLVTALALMVSLSVSCTAFAAANPFVDVPQGHWSYNAVSKLAADGIIDGEADGTFKGDKVVTRYELAQVIARAMAKEDKASAEDKALIQKLGAEFKEELEGLGVRIKALEEKTHKIEIDGSAYFRYNSRDVNDTYYYYTDTGTASSVYNQDLKDVDIDLHYTYNVGQGWVVKMESEYKRLINLPTIENNPNVNSLAEELYSAGPLGEGYFAYGRHRYVPGYGLTYNEKASGGQYTFGNKVKTTINWGHTTTKAELRAAEIVADIGDNTHIRANYEAVQNISTYSGYDKYYGIGFDTGLSKDILFKAAAAKSDIIGSNDKSKAYLAYLQYKTANKDIENSNDFFVGYSKVPDNVAYNERPDSDDYSYDFKGARIGFDYVPMKNILFNVWYMTGKAISTDTNLHIVRVQANMYF